MDRRVDPELVERFRKALDQLGAKGKLGLAVSGGADSMAMLALADETEWEIEVATVNHGLRPEAADECALVEEECARRDIQCATLRISIGAGNTQDSARKARYKALTDWARERSIEAVLTAHHANDQVETLMMRLNRGSGLTGLAGIRPRRILTDDEPHVLLLRPLLGFQRSELLGLVQQAGLPFVDDPSNSNDKFDRVRMRNMLASLDIVDPLDWVKSAEFLNDAYEYVREELSNCWQSNVTPVEAGFSYLAGNSRFENTEMVMDIFTAMGVKPRKSDISALVDRLSNGQKSNLAGILASPMRSRGPGNEREWTFQPEPPRRTG